MTGAGGPGGAPRPSGLARWSARALVALIAVVMFAMMMLTTVDVAGRYLFNAPIKGGFEIVTFLLAILIFSSFPLVTWREEHITVSLFDERIRGRAAWALRAVILLASTAVAGAIAWRMWVQGELMEEGQHITGFLEWPIAPVAYFMAVLAALATAVLAINLVLHLAGRAPSRPPGFDEPDISANIE